MRLRPLLFPFLLALALVGCRDALVDPAAEPIDEPPPESELPTPYFKGPIELELGHAGSFRVEAVAGATRYNWVIEETSTGRLTGTFTADAQGRERQFNAVATEPGTVVLFVSITDAEGRTIASATKTVRVVLD